MYREIQFEKECSLNFTRAYSGIKVACQRFLFFAFRFRRSIFAYFARFASSRRTTLLFSSREQLSFFFAILNKKSKKSNPCLKKKHLLSIPAERRIKIPTRNKERGRERDSCSAKCGSASILYNPPHNPPSHLRTLDAAALKEVLFKVIQLPPSPHSIPAEEEEEAECPLLSCQGFPALAVVLVVAMPTRPAFPIPPSIPRPFHPLP